MAKKKTAEEIYEAVKEINESLEVLSFKNSENIEIKCEHGHIYHTSLAHLRRQRRCPYCTNYHITPQLFKQQINKLNPNIELLSDYVNAKTKIKYKCKIHNKEFESTPNCIKQLKSCCPLGGAEMAIENKKKRIKEEFFNNANINPTIEIIGEFTRMVDPIQVKCKICGKVWNSIARYIFKGSGCKECSIKLSGIQKRMSNEEFLSKLKFVNENILPLQLYVKSNQKILCKCLKCNHEWEVTPNSLLSGCGCPKCNCNTSHLQLKVDKFLQEQGIEFKREWSCSLVPHHPVSNRAMPFNNEIVGLNLLLEIDGEQHNRITPLTHKTAKSLGITSEEALLRRKEYDKYKEQVAYENGYQVLRIPWYLEKDDKYKKVILDKIDEIKRQK